MSIFYCTKCHRQGLPVWRNKGSKREAGHLKKLYCCNCQKETNHVEITEDGIYTKDILDKEFEYNNFDENGVRKQPWRNFLSSIEGADVI